MFTLPKSERLHGKSTVSALVSEGRWGYTSGLKYCFVLHQDSCGEAAPSRMMVSVPKRLFKRAVKRNLLKRRIREAYRTRKSLLVSAPADVMFVYNSKEVLDFESIRSQVESILKRIAGNERQQ